MESSLHVRFLGPLTIERDGAALALPSSRKVRALVAYLGLTPRPVTRDHLCELLGEGSSDPRAELSWCLSKIRGLFDTPGRVRLTSSGAAVSLDLDDCDVDAVPVARAIQAGLGQTPIARLVELSARCAGELVAGLELDRSPLLNAWLIAQRRHFRACQVAILEQIVRLLPPSSPERLAVLDRWLGIAGLDRAAHELLLTTLAHQGLTREGAEHLAAARKLFEAEGLDDRPLRELWDQATRRRREVAVAVEAAVVPDRPPAPRRASIAVMPLTGPADPGSASTARSLVHDVITRLARLRSLRVIAQGTVFALGDRGIGPEAAGRILDVDYVVGGAVRHDADRVTVMLELVETRTARIVWADDIHARRAETFEVLEAIGTRIAAVIADEVEASERGLAVLKPPSSLDAWEAHHRGLWHMYRFTADDNAEAQRFFEQAVRLDPTFSRAHAALAWTYRQEAVVHRRTDPRDGLERARASASTALAADGRDPAAHWAMGIALWGYGPHHGRHQDDAARALQQAVALSPSYATAYNMLAFVESQLAEPRQAIRSADCARQLSPFDPTLFVPLVSRAIAHLRLGELDEAAAWALAANRRPNAHVHVKGIAAHCLLAVDRVDEARAVVADIRRTQPDYSIASYLGFYLFGDDVATWCRAHAPRIGLA